MTSPHAPSPHAPVLLAEVLEALNPQSGDVIVDATFGAGGYIRSGTAGNARHEAWQGRGG